MPEQYVDGKPVGEQYTDGKVLDQEGEGLVKEFSANPFRAVDFTDSYANNKNYIIAISHLPSGTTTTFKGMLTDYQDQFTSDWASESVYGRMDDIHTFRSTKRQITLAFVAPAFNVKEARRNLLEVSKLAKQLYPSYTSGGGATSISRPPLLRLKFTNLIKNAGPGQGGILGKMNGFTFAPNLDAGFFDYPDLLYPKQIDIAFTYDVMHEHSVGWGDDGLWLEGSAFPYLTPQDLELSDQEGPKTGTGVSADAMGLAPGLDSTADLSAALGDSSDFENLA